MKIGGHCEVSPYCFYKKSMRIKLSDKFLIESMIKRISSLEIQLGQKNSDIDELRFKNKVLKQTIKDKDLEIKFFKLELDVYINKIGAEN